MTALVCLGGACDSESRDNDGAGGSSGASAGVNGKGGAAGASGGTGGAAGPTGGTRAAGGTKSGGGSFATAGTAAGADAAGAAGTSTSPGAGGEPGSGGAPEDSLSARHPDEAALVADPAVLFHDDFEQGWGRWDAPTADTRYLFIETDSAAAHAGSRYLRSTVTEAQLAMNEYISASTRVTFERRVERMYWRFYAQFKGIAPTPHHWVRVAAGTEDYDSSGLANTVPPGDEGFWFDFDANIDDRFSFYVYWYKMRSGRCNDGSATPGCAGDQGRTYYYGNTFAPAEQDPFPRDQWFCIEIMAKANTVGKSDGELAFWIDDELIAEFRPGFPEGTWLRDRFHPGGCTFSACEEPMPFEGFDFRTSDDVLFKSVFLDAYYERNTTADRRAALEERGLTVSSEQTVLYDDVVVATQRIGCGNFR